MKSITRKSIDTHLATLGMTGSDFRRRLDQLLTVDAARLGRLWSYYRNPMRAGSTTQDTASPQYRQAQEWGLPRRIKGDDTTTDVPRREVVIENDIAWRLDATIDFLFGKPIVLTSAAANESRRATITQLLRAILANHGGLAFLQQLSLIGAVYGHVDVLVKLLPSDEPQPIASTQSTQNFGSKPTSERSDESDSATQNSAPKPTEKPTPQPAPQLDEDPSHPGAITPSPEAVARLARQVRLEIVEPARALPVLSSIDFAVVEAYAQVYRIHKTHDVFRETASDAPNASWFRKLFAARGLAADNNDETTVIDLITPTRWMTFHNDRVVAQGKNTLGQIPLVHIQNVAIPFSYTGASDVEPLLPLQDELNTRLSDRAHRIAMQSFRMYLGKGIDGFTQHTVSPGRMWMSDDPDAQIIEFGGDGGCPSEDAHIRDLREALDKISGVSPIAAGAIKGRIGRLTSAAALRVTMLSLLARTERKRATYGAGIARLCELALTWLDHAGLFKTSPDERRIELDWPNPIPLNELERLDEAKQKLEVGVPRDIVLKELGY